MKTIQLWQLSDLTKIGNMKLQHLVNHIEGGGEALSLNVMSYYLKLSLSF